MTPTRLVLYGKRPCLRRQIDLTRGSGDITIDASRLEWASPADLTAIAAIAATAQGRLDLVLPDDADVAQYLRRMSIVAMVEDAGGRVTGPSTLSTINPLPTRLLEVRCMNGSDVRIFGSDVFKLVAEHAGDHGASFFYSMFGELLDNTLQHAKSPVGAFGAAQVHSGATSGRPGVEVALADAGIGILSSLRSNPEHAHLETAEGAIRSALRKGVSSQTAEYRGEGLSRVTAQLGRRGGVLLLRSSDGLARVTPGRRSFSTTATSTPGTWAWLWIDLAIANIDAPRVVSLGQ